MRGGGGGNLPIVSVYIISYHFLLFCYLLCTVMAIANLVQDPGGGGGGGGWGGGIM